MKPEKLVQTEQQKIFNELIEDKETNKINLKNAPINEDGECKF